MRTCVLFGDSHLARVGKPLIATLEASAAPLDVYNASAGGWNSADLARKAGVVARLGADVVVVSVGANDAAPWKRVEPDVFRAHLRTALEAFAGSRRLVLVLPPVDEAAQPPEGKRSNEEFAAYRDATLAVCAELDVEPVDVWPVFAAGQAAGDHLHDADGTHLNARGYELLIAELARAVGGG